MNLVNFLQSAIVLDRTLQNEYPNHHRVFNSIESSIQEAWKIWDAETLRTYYDGDKPENPTRDFELQWIANEDFEADGYDTEEMCKAFGVDRY